MLANLKLEKPLLIITFTRAINLLTSVHQTHHCTKRKRIQQNSKNQLTLSIRSQLVPPLNVHPFTAETLRFSEKRKKLTYQLSFTPVALQFHTASHIFLCLQVCPFSSETLIHRNVSLHQYYTYPRAAWLLVNL